MIRKVRETLATRPSLQQFVKFCIVGASSFTLDILILNSLFYGIGLPLLLAKGTSFLAGVSNGFVWNSRWTFRQADRPSVRYPVFVATNVVGLVLNLAIMTGAIIAASRMGLGPAERPPAEIAGLVLTGAGRRAFDPLTVNGATFVATVVVTAWNFSAAKWITFKN